MNKNLNIEDIQKFTKYQLKINALRGGGSQQKQGIYNKKINEYTERLQKSGVDTNKLIEIIQQGGNPTQMLERFKNAIEEKLTEVGGITKDELNAAVLGINQAVTTHNSLKTEYGQYVTDSKRAFTELYNTAKTKGDNVAKIGDLTNIKQININKDIDEVRTALEGLDELFRD